MGGSIERGSGILTSDLAQVTGNVPRRPLQSYRTSWFATVQRSSHRITLRHTNVSEGGNHLQASGGHHVR